MKPASAIYLCGPIADPGMPAKGGYQSNNLRTIEALQYRGIEVHALPYAQPESSGIRKLIEYAVSFWLLALKVVTCEKRSILHITGLRRIFIYPEIALVYLGKLKKCRTIYDVRDGLTLEAGHLNRSTIYRRCFTLILRSVDLVMVEGESQVPFVESLTGVTPVHIPNQVDLTSIPSRIRMNGDKPKPVIAYAGTMRPEKGISTILEAAEILKNNGVAVTVRLAGTGDRNFIDDLRRRHRDLPVDWLGAQTSAGVLDLFSTSHFFVFPTRWPGEGQSNSLTEAMACGAVPIVSDHGFNAATVGGCGAILSPNDSAAEYAATLQRIWDGGQWEELSQMAVARVRECFSSSAVIDHLIEQYVSLESPQCVG